MGEEGGGEWREGGREGVREEGGTVCERETSDESRCRVDYTANISLISSNSQHT